MKNIALTLFRVLTTSRKFNSRRAVKRNRNVYSKCGCVLLSFLVLALSVFNAAAVSLGDRVEANGTVNVRSTPAGTPASGQQSSGSLGVVIGGPSTATLSGTSYTWYDVDFDTGVDGWVADSGSAIGLTVVAPAAPTQNSPGNTSSPGPTISTLTPTMSWNSALGANGYGVYVEDVATSTLVYNVDNVGNVTSITLPSGTLLAGHSYVWNMRSSDSVGYTYCTTHLYFQTQAASQPPTHGIANQVRADSGASMTDPATLPQGVGVYFRVTPTDPQGNTVRMEVEWHQLPASFTGTANLVSSYVSSGSQATTPTLTGLAAGNYGWAYRVVDSQGLASVWVPNNNPDFTVQASAPSIASVSPNPVSGTNGTQPFYINGANFVANCDVILRDLTAGQTFSNRTIVSFSSTQIQIAPNFTTAMDNWSVEVINPDNQSSGQYSFNVVLPNLAPQNISLNTNAVAPGGTLTVSWTLANTGSGNSPSTVTGVRINQSTTSFAGTDITNVPMPALNANSSTPQSAQIIVPTTPGTYYVWIIADNVLPASAIPQSNYGDDELHSVAFTVTAPTQLPNLVPQNINLSSTSLASGATLTVSWTLANTGSGNSPSTVTGVRINQSTTSFTGYDLTNVPMPALNANSTTPQSAQIIVPTTPGIYYVWIIADNVLPANAIVQSNYEDDELHSAAFTVTNNATGGSSSLPCSGTGDWIYHMNDYTGGQGCINTLGVSDMQGLVNYEKNKGVKWIAVKCGDGDYGIQANANYDSYYANQFNSTLITLCHNAGIKVFGWVYVYGGGANSDGVPTDVAGETSVATAALALSPDGIIVDWESEYESLGSMTATNHAAQYCQGIRNSYPTSFMAHAPIWDPIDNLPDIYMIFGKYCQVVMPQYYCSIYATTQTWLNPVSPSTMLQECDSVWNEQQISWINSGHSDSVKPIVPVIWAATPTTGQEMLNFVNDLKNDSTSATAGGYQGVSFWDCDSHTSDIWNTISSVTIGTTTSPTPPNFTGSQISGGAFQTTLSGLSSGETVTLQVSTDLINWTPFQTNVMSGSTLSFTNTINPATKSQYFRTVVQ